MNKALSDKAYDLIIKYEVGGGKNYYTRALQRPTYPGGASGVTIGIGYDIGYNTLHSLTKDWEGIIPDADLNRLKGAVGKKRHDAKAYINKVRDIKIPWSAAEEVFNKKTLPKFIANTKRAFPGAQDLLSPDGFGVLVSLVFNRGGSMKGSTRKEMANIRSAIKNGTKSQDLNDYIADQIRSMKRLWVGKGLDGLLTRRDEEAKVIQRS